MRRISISRLESRATLETPVRTLAAGGGRVQSHVAAATNVPCHVAQPRGATVLEAAAFPSALVTEITFLPRQPGVQVNGRLTITGGRNLAVVGHSYEIKHLEPAGSSHLTAACERRAREGEAAA